MRAFLTEVIFPDIMAHVYRFFIYLLFLQLSTSETFCTGNHKCSFVLNTDFEEQITVQENDVVNFTFRINDTSCWTGNIMRIEVHKDGRPECIMSQSDNVCKKTNRTTTCSCLQDSLYLFYKEINRKDEGNWTWCAKEGFTVVGRKTMLFNIQYPANVVRLEIDGQDVHSSHTLVRNRNASIRCIWENGNPPITARLLDNIENILITETFNNLTYTYMSSTCQNETNITCEADGSIKNISVSLLTICPPEFVRSSPKPVVSTKHAFPIRSYTGNISGCSIYKLSELSNISNIENKYHLENKAIVDNVTCLGNHTSERYYCQSSLDNYQQGQYCSCDINQTLLNFVLILQLHNFKEQDEGEWILVLSNLGGCDTVGFTLRLSETNVKDNEATDYFGLWAGTMASITPVALFIIVIFVVKKKRNKAGSRKSEEVNNCVHYSSPNDYATHGDITIMVNGVCEASEEFVSPAVLSTNDGVDRNERKVVENNDMYSRVMKRTQGRCVDRNEGTVVAINDIYSRVTKRTQGRLVDNDLNTKPEGTQSYNNLYYESVSAKKDVEMNKAVIAMSDVEMNNVLRDTIEDVPECADPFYGIKNCMQGNLTVESGPQENIYSLACSLDENRNSETGLTSVADTCNQSDVIDVRKQPQVLHIRNLDEARQNVYTDVSIERQDTGVFQKSAHSLLKKHE